ncbi:hypothetical protein FLGE108171_07235 [Flavobacterium gelidilacus]|uniref:hypothetical protein n=1 Tax=Flavobacterium gelidilacus TaxID=206041 RepID=UPI000417BCD8|nr:hypothetical protein [Flavobacterium gelidilacus]
MTNKVKIFLYAFLLILFSLSLALHIINGFKSGNFEYIRIVISLFATGLALYQIILLSKLENKK